MSRNRLLAVTILAASSGWAGSAVAQPVTGLYIGAGGGANFMEREQVRTVAPPGLPTLFGKAGFDTGYVALGSVGYGFGNGVRVEVEGNYRRNDIKGSQSNLAVTGRERKYGPMANVLFDLDVSSPYVFPYIGAGAGYQWVDERAALTSGSLSAAVNNREGGFAYQAIAGLSFPIPPVVGLSLTAEYRYAAVSGTRDYPTRVVGLGTSLAGQVRAKADFNHSLLLGLRYAFDVAPPPPPASAVATSPPASVPAQTYLIFFDWDRADLTPRAKLVVAEAARGTTRTQVTRIEVNGYTDTSGTTQYNRSLSVRRANAVASELVRDGVPRNAIGVQGFGQTQLAVPTADGVREPQNRRVEIILK